MNIWPSLPFPEWKETCATLHMWTQIVGKVRLTLSPWTNHSWHVTLYVTARGLTTSPISFGARVFQVDFDFVEHALRVQTSDGDARVFDSASPSSVRGRAPTRCTPWARQAGRGPVPAPPRPRRPPDARAARPRPRPRRPCSRRS